MSLHRTFDRPAAAPQGASCPFQLLVPVLGITMLMASVMAGGALARPAGDPVRDSVRDPGRVRICSGKGEVTLQVDGRQLAVTRREDGQESTTVIDLDEVGRLVGDAVGQAMAAMEDVQIQVRLGQDNRLNVTTGDGVVEVDLDQIMTEVAAAVQSGLAGIETVGWVSTGPRDEQQLQRELADLQAEMRALREELRRLRDQTPPAAPPAPPAPTRR